MSDERLGKSYDEMRRSHLLEVHVPVQRIALFAVGPIAIALMGLSFFMDRCWQNAVILGGIVSMVVFWGVAFSQCKRGNLESSGTIALVSILFYETIQLFMMRGGEASAVLGLMAMICYATLFSKRHLVWSAAGMGLVLVASEIVKYAEPYPVNTLEPMEKMINLIGFSALIVPMIVFILLRNHTINKRLVAMLDSRNEDQARIISTANRISPVMDEVVRGFQEVANGIAGQAGQQAGATAEVQSAMELIQTIAKRTAGSASMTEDLALAIKDDSVRSRDLMRTLQKRFADLSQELEAAMAIMEDLASKAENIEDVLNYNREISEQIKVLAINAAIQAAEAGQYGTGFRVVAEELRALIHDTDANLERSGALLTAIRDGSSKGREKISLVGDLFSKQSAMLGQTRELVGKIIDGFVETSDSVVEISRGAKEQHVSVSEVGTAMEQIHAAAGHLKGSSAILMEGLDRIVDSQNELRDVLTVGEA